MIEIKIAIIPFGDNKLKRSLGTIKIANDTTGDTNTGNYKYTLKDPTTDSTIKGKLKGFKRLEKNVFFLMRDILNKAL